MTRTVTTRRLTGLKPTGEPHLGILLGAIQPMVRDQYTSDATVFLADLHALTAAHEPRTLRETTLRHATVLLAAGLDPDRTVFYVQSQVPDHAELHFLLERTAARGRAAYPVLQASDILLHDTAEVPVGADQRPRVALTRDIAMRFNQRYGPTFVVPEPVTPTVAARVMDLANPTVKMGQTTSSASGAIGLLDPPALVTRKLSRAVTETDGIIAYDPAARPGVSNLLEILAACVGGTPVEIGTALRGYGDLRRATTEAVLGLLGPLRARFETLARDPGYVRQVLAEGAERARSRTAETVFRAKRAIGVLA
ncbi:tryptophan--tRNA ligase [Asanoa sp. WMMD1127]|uniref:tryptophan--tRNA ligase n=1 Tax=Asanoa sp. WMMD1127 TaxID=3016107 RepID=UPI0024173264|nr:tryptophan--tRNA ligase [Asanoa sp. WMMD1127]MDG4827637.1 tryptophan--tRNA ligase [Asanoa sp. WMMD1127]